MKGTRGFRVFALAAGIALGAMVLAPAAEAGCLTEYNACEGCAKKRMRQGILTGNLFDIRQANLELWDCAIDLNHCIFFGQHHDYKCAL